MIYKHILPQNIAERALNITSFLNNLKYFTKQVYQKQRTENINKKNDQNNYFRAEISRKEKQLLTLNVKDKIDF